jgi:hypothetical protein
MAGKPIEPSPARGSASDRGEDEGKQPRPSERCGPIAVTRLLKDDGRRLILFARAEDPA